MRDIDYSKSKLINCPLCGCSKFIILAKRFDGGRIVRCFNCKHNYLNPTLTQEIINKIYSQEYYVTEDDNVCIQQFEEWFLDPEGQYQITLKWLLKYLGLRDTKILEIGCGTGCFLAECAKYGAEVMGIDPSPKAIELAQKYYGITLIRGYLESVEQLGLLGRSTYDVVVLFAVIEHVLRPYEFIKTVSKFIKKGSYLILSTSNFLLFKLQGKSYEGLNNYPEHIQFFEPKTIEGILKKLGFEIYLLTTVNPINYGERIKFKMISLGIVKSIWEKAKVNKSIYSLKDLFLSLLDKIKTKEDREHLNGRQIFCIAVKIA